jgi:hypothetical protein
MKTVKKDGEIKRVDDLTADYMVQTGWEYCSKSEWKTIRPNKKSDKELVIEEISNNLSDKKKRKLRKENKRNKYESGK